MIWNRSKTWKMLKDESGAALMMALFTFTVLAVIASEVMYQTSVEYAVSTQAVNQVKAHYAAKAGVEISLLRLHVYKSIMGSIDKKMAQQIPMLDMIWQMPFAWPPVVEAKASSITKSEIAESVKTSSMKSQYLATIESEGSKIDLSLLASNEKLVQITANQLLQIFTARMNTDSDYAAANRGTDFQAVINNMIDWVDENKTQVTGGGDESSLYQAMNNKDQLYPPNQPFKTFQEIHMVSGMTDEMYNMILPRVTVYGTQAINVKYASKEVLQAAFDLDEEKVTLLLEERGKEDTTILQDETSFRKYLETLGVSKETLYESDTQPETPRIPILVEPEFNFRVKSTGVAGKVSRDITALVYDYDRVLEQYKKGIVLTEEEKARRAAEDATKYPGKTPEEIAALKAKEEEERKKKESEQGSGAGGAKGPKKERPTIVYWNET